MKRYLPVMAALAVLLWLPAGASAYDIQFGDVNSDLSWVETSVGDSSGDYNTYTPSGSSHQSPPTSGVPYGAGATSLATDPFFYPNSSVSANCAVIVSQPQVQWGSGGVGKDTYFTININSSLMWQLATDQVDGSYIYSAMVTPTFLATRENNGTPQLKISVSRGGTGSDVMSAGGDFYAYVPGSSKINPIGDSGFSVDASGPTLVPVTDLDAFLNNPSLYWSLSLSLMNMGFPSGEDGSADPWVSVRLDLIEPDMTNPDPAPVPPSLLLLGSGLLTLALARRRHKGHRQVG